MEIIDKIIISISGTFGLIAGILIGFGILPIRMLGMVVILYGNAILLILTDLLKRKKREKEK